MAGGPGEPVAGGVGAPHLLVDKGGGTTGEQSGRETDHVIQTG